MDTERFDTVVDRWRRRRDSPSATTSRDAGVPSLILDANERIGDAWRNGTTRSACSRRRATIGLPGMPLPGKDPAMPDQGRDGRLPRVLRGDFALPVRLGVTRERLVARATDSSIEAGDAHVRGDERRRRYGRPPCPSGAGVRTGARPGDRADALERVPQPVAAAATAGSWSSARATPAPTSRSRSLALASVVALGRGAGELPVRHRRRDRQACRLLVVRLRCTTPC